MEVLEVLAHGVGRSLVPRLAAVCLLCGEDLNETAVELVEYVSACDVVVQ